MDIIKYPSQILEQRLQDFDFNNPIIDPLILEKDMLETMYSNHGLGLSANQVGINARVFVMGQYKGDGVGIFNPVILNAQNIIEDEEGCLSFPGIFVKIKRPSKITARWQNSKGEFIEGDFSGYTCKCFLHEFDHLEGVVFKDRVSTLKWALALKKLQKRNR